MVKYIKGSVLPFAYISYITTRMKITKKIIHDNSGTPLVRPPLLHPECGLSRGGGLSSGVEINTFMFRFTLSSGLSRGDGLSKGVPLYYYHTCCFIIEKLSITDHAVLPQINFFKA